MRPRERQVINGSGLWILDLPLSRCMIPRARFLDPVRPWHKLNAVLVSKPHSPFKADEKSVGFRLVPCDRHGDEKETPKPKANEM